MGLGPAFSSLGQNLQRMSNTMYDMRERAERRRDNTTNQQLDQIRMQTALAQLQMLRQEQAATAIFSPTDAARLKLEEIEAERQYNKLLAAKAEDDAAAAELEFEIKQETKDATIEEAKNKSAASGVDLLAKQQGLQKNLIDAVMPSEKEMEILSRYFPERMNQFNTVASTLRSHVLPMDEFQEYLSGMNELLIVPIDDTVAAGLGYPAGTELDLPTFAQSFADRRYTHDKIEGVFADLAAMKVEDPDQYKATVTGLFGTQAAADDMQKLMAAEGMDIFASPMQRAYMDQQVPLIKQDIETQALAREQNGKLTSDLWDLYKDVTPRKLLMGLAGDETSDRMAELQRGRTEDLESIRESAPDLPGLVLPGVLNGGTFQEKFRFRDWAPDTGVTHLYDPTRRKVVDITKEGYGYELPQVWMNKVRDELGEKKFAQIMAIPDENRRRAVLAHYESKLPGGFNKNFFNPAFGGPLMNIVPRSMEGLHNGMMQELMDENLGFDLLASGIGGLLGRVAGPTLKTGKQAVKAVTGKFGKKAAAEVASPAAKAATEVIEELPPLGQRAIDTMGGHPPTGFPMPDFFPPPVSGGPMMKPGPINPFAAMQGMRGAMPTPQAPFPGLAGLAPRPPMPVPMPSQPAPPLMRIQDLFPKPAGPMLPPPNTMGVRMPNALDFIGRSNVPARMQGSGRMASQLADDTILEQMLGKNVGRADELAKAKPKPKPKPKKKSGKNKKR